MPNLTPQLLRSRLGKVCVSIAGSSVAEMLEKATSVVKETPFVEFRLDYLEKPLLALPKLKAFLTANPTVTAIATCRRENNGGRFSGPVAAEMEVLSKAAAAGFHIVDLEVESAESTKKAELQKLRESGVALLISHHDFQATKDLDEVYKRIARFHPEFIKIVPTAKTLADNITLMRLIEQASEHSNIIGIAMGEAGIISRVLGLRAGSAFTFAAASAGDETGPGQIAARTLFETYRIDRIDTATKVYGVAGNPIKSSLSPLMLNTAFQRETVNAVYLALQTSKVSDLIKLAEKVPLQGFSVTMPHKQEIMKYLEKTDALSAKIGACNTVLRAQDGKLYGFNTDVEGILRPLMRRIPLQGAKILVLGAGGVARAAVFGLRDKGAEVFILNRTPETAQKLARQSGSKTIKKEAVAKTPFDVIVNATPVGMIGQRAAHILEASDLNAKLVFDLVYNPLETPLIRMARQQNIPIITGVEMFVQQGARQFEIWTGKPAPEEEMLRVVIHVLRQQAEAAPPAPEAQPVQKSEPQKKSVPTKQSAPAKKSEPAKKSVPVKKNAPAKKTVPAKKSAQKKSR